MSFVYSIALGVALLVAIPFLAHRLRRRRAEERTFAAARLVPPAPPKARRRSKLEDRLLFATRALAIAALALLGASPLVRCSRLSLQRSGGASVAFAIVIDDSMSMRASGSSGGKTRFVRARDGARELLASARDGDAVAIVLAGAPARVALAATTDLGAAQAAIDAIAESDRATDLDGALVLARGLVASLPQVDRRIVVLSDMADGQPDAPPLGERSSMPVWFAMPELRGPAADCGVLRADRTGTRVRAAVACSDPAAAAGREISVVAPDKTVLARAALPQAKQSDVTLTLPTDNDEGQLIARLGGPDAIASDDEAPVVMEAGPGAIAVVADMASEAAATGGAPVVEQALSAIKESLKLDVAVRPLPALPDRTEDLSSFVGLILDDPPGLTPEQRYAMAAFFDGGGVVLVALGPRAAAMPLGATLEPILDRAVTWGASPVRGADQASSTGPLDESVESLADLSAKERAVLSPEDVAAVEPLLKWSDGAPMIAKKRVGRGAAWIVTLPFSVEASDLTLRTGFVALLDGWLDDARARAAPRRTDVGVAWTFPGAALVVVEGPGGPVATDRDVAGARAVAPLAGVYRVNVDGRREVRVASPIAREIDFRARAAVDASSGPALGDNHAAVDISSAVAVLLLAVLACEMALRLWSRGRAEVA